MKSYAFQKIKSFISSICLIKALKPSGEPVLFKENLYYSFGKCHPASVNAYVFNFYTSKIIVKDVSVSHIKESFFQRSTKNV